jgi:hypothetical protein
VSTETEHASHEPIDSTQLMPVLFRDGLDRRMSARIPVFGPVKMGPPSGEPYAIVSASNLSPHGLFIDSDRPVRVGARFSAEIPLAGETVYVPEAEVAYNREHPHGSGFGVRFIEPPPEVVQKIEAEVERVTRPLPAPKPADTKPKVEPKVESKSKQESKDEPKQEPKLEPKPRQKLPSMPPLSHVSILRPKDPSETETIRPARTRRAMNIDLDLAYPPEPVFDEAPHASEISVLPHDTLPPDRARRTEREGIRGIWEETMRRAHDARHRFVEGTRRYPSVWIGVASVGALAVVAAGGLALHRGSRIEVAEVAPVKEARGISPSTQQALMGEHQLPLVVDPPLATKNGDRGESVETKRPLPPLVIMEDAPKVLRVEGTGTPPAKVEIAPKDGNHPPAKAAAKPSPPSFSERARQILSETKRAVAAHLELTASASKHDRDSRASKGAHPARIHFGIAPRASVLKTHVFRSPNRFVIDLLGQDQAPALPAPSGAIKQVRFGKHPDFARVVIETEAPIDQARVSKEGKDLRVTIDFAS